jgi:hypothetical protein
VTPQRAAASVETAGAKTRFAVMVPWLVTTGFVTEAESSPAAVPAHTVPVTVTVAPVSKPAPLTVMAVVEPTVVTKATAEGLTSWMP